MQLFAKQALAASAVANILGPLKLPKSYSWTANVLLPDHEIVPGRRAVQCQNQASV